MMCDPVNEIMVRKEVAGGGCGQHWRQSRLVGVVFVATSLVFLLIASLHNEITTALSGLGSHTMPQPRSPLLRSLQASNVTAKAVPSSAGTIPATTTPLHFSSPLYEYIQHHYLHHHSMYSLLTASSISICTQSFVQGHISADMNGNAVILSADNFLWALLFNLTYFSNTEYEASHPVSYYPRSWMVKYYHLDAHDVEVEAFYRELQMLSQQRGHRHHLFPASPASPASPTSSQSSATFLPASTDFKTMIPTLKEIFIKHQCPVNASDEYEIFRGILVSFGFSLEKLRCCHIEEAVKSIRFIGPGYIPGLSGTRLAFEALDGIYHHHDNNDFSLSFQHKYNLFTTNIFDIIYHINISDYTQRQMKLWSNMYSIEAIRGYIVYGHLSFVIGKVSAEVIRMVLPLLEDLFTTSKGQPSVYLDKLINSLDSNKTSDYDFKTYPHLYFQYPKDTLILGVHARHQFDELDREYGLDHCLEECFMMKWWQLRNETKQQYKRCVLLIAADRNHSLLAMETLAKTIECEARYIRRNMTLGMETDHGPWGDSIYSSADIFLLSHAQYFLGLHISTYSMEIASLIAARWDVHYFFQHHQHHSHKHPSSSSSSVHQHTSPTTLNLTDHNKILEVPFLWYLEDTCIDRNVTDPDQPLELYCGNFMDNPPDARDDVTLSCHHKSYEYSSINKTCI